MREILFRGKRVSTETFVYGYYVLLAERNHSIVNETGNFYVIPKTVGQFTGLTDKNGKRIFEGDIIECWSEGVKAKGTVQQRKDGLWIIYPAWQKTIMWGLCPDECCHTTVEVIGNIHDNPELMEDK